jgi:hypothetical protein
MLHLCQCFFKFVNYSNCDALISQNNSDVVNCVTFNWNDTNIASGTTNGDILVHNVSTTLTSTPLRLPQTQVKHVIK